MRYTRKNIKKIQRIAVATIAGMGLALLTGCIIEEPAQESYAPGPAAVEPATLSPEMQALFQRAQQGNAVSQFTLGSCYANGRGVYQNYAEAVIWYHQSAIQNYAPAQNRVGVCYARGWGVRRNFAQAAGWFYKSASQGFAPAQDNLGNCYYRGTGVQRSYAEAAKWFQLAAAQNNVPAQNSLAYLQQMGLVAMTVPTPVTTATTTTTTVTTRLSAPVPTQPPASPPAESENTSAGNALTVDEIKELTTAGVKPDVLIGQIKDTNSRFTSQDIALAQQARPPIDAGVISCMESNVR